MSKANTDTIALILWHKESLIHQSFIVMLWRHEVIYLQLHRDAVEVTVA